MKTQRKLVVALGFLLVVLCCSVIGRGVARVIAWGRDLPHRIVIDGDAFVESFGTAIVQSYHEALINGDPNTQSEAMRDFSNFAADDAALQDWIRNEFTDDLRHLTSSSDPEVSRLAAELLEQLALPRDDAVGQPESLAKE